VSYIYFITNEDEKLVKIGFSKNPLGRLKQLETASSSKLKLAKVIKGTRESEVKYHRLFSRYKVRREWFRLSEEILCFIAREVSSMYRCTDNELFVAYEASQKNKKSKGLEIFKDFKSEE
jgi:hypothetical protein